MPLYREYQTLITPLGGRPYREVLAALKHFQKKDKASQNRPPNPLPPAPIK